MNVLIIHNPVAGGRRLVYLKKVVAELESLSCKVTLQSTTGRGDAEAFARQACQNARSSEDGPDIVAAAGGDGTINEVINGMVGADLPLAIIPLGTANVLANEISLPKHPKSVARVIRNARLMKATVGSANGRIFVQMVGAGMDADVVSLVSSKTKRWLGKAAYALAIARWLFAPPNTRYKAVVDGKDYAVTSVILANGKYYAGRFVCARQAELTSPCLYACLFENGGRLATIKYLVALGLGRLEKMKGYRSIACQSVTIIPSGLDVSAEEGRFPLQADGDIVTALPAHITVVPSKLSLVVPNKIAV